jgi:hypothetical protein
MPVKKATASPKEPTTKKAPAKKASSKPVAKAETEEWSTSHNVSIIAKLYNVELVMQDAIKKAVSKNLAGKMDSYLKKLSSKKDAVVSLDYKIERNKHNKYDGKFRLSFDGKQYMYMTKTSFKFVEDIVSHAFDHFKLMLSETK